MINKYSLALAGRTNVGKSSIFNALLGYNRSLVGDIENLTRDFLFEEIQLPSGQSIDLFDTAGLEGQGPFSQDIEHMTLQFLESVNLCLLVLDASVGILDEDIRLYRKLKQHGICVQILWNKIDLADPNVFFNAYKLTNQSYFTVQALCSDSTKSLLEKISVQINDSKTDLAPSNNEEDSKIFGFFGRPNVGKSSLSNLIAQKRNRFLVSSQAGTTRDYVLESVDIFSNSYMLCDSAGLLNTKNTHPDILERMTYYRVVMALKKVHVAVVVIDATQGLCVLDKKILELIQKFRRGLVIAINKWDLLSTSEKTFLKDDLSYRLKGYSYAPVVEVSAVKKTHISLLKRSIVTVMNAFFSKVSTSQVNQFLQKLVVAHEPPIRSGFRIKLRYAHVIDTSPLTFLIHGTQLQKLPQSYIRFLRNSFCEHFDLHGIPLKISFKNTVNPYIEALT